ncbi:MAG: leucine-rich repeat protein, partial [Lachnospiraceae bacterium]|nr:leucine-rich repeat protein [Lachnospiraceae bacterium]
MKRRIVSAVFSVVLALSVWGNSVYASGMDGAGALSVTAETVETEESVEASVETSVEENASGETEDAASKEDTDSEASAEESVETSEANEPEESAEEGGEPEESKEESGGAEESTEETDNPEESAEGSGEVEEPTEDANPEESTEESSEVEESTEENGEPGESIEESGTPEESAEESGEPADEEDTASEELISDEETNEVYYASTSDGWNFTINGNYATITGYTGTDTVLNVPATVRDSATGKYYSVTAIGYAAFSAEFGNNTGYEVGKRITEITLPDSVTSIGAKAFNSCENLKKAHLGNGVTTIGDEAFAYSGITGIIFPKSVSSLGYKVLCNCDSLGTIQLDCQVTVVPAGFAAYCDNLVNVMLGDQVTGYRTSYDIGRYSYTSYPFENTPMLKAVYTSITDWRFLNTIDSTVSVYNSSNPVPNVSKPTLKVAEDAESRGVLMTTDTPGAIIFYSTTGSSMNLENDWVASGNGVDFTFFKGTVYARA